MFSNSKMIDIYLHNYNTSHSDKNRVYNLDDNINQKVIPKKFKLSLFHRASSHMAGAESPSLADLSSNNGDDSPHRAKKGGGAKRKSRNARNLLTPTGYSSGAEIISQSAFPIPTPDRLGPLTDLLEEDMSELPSRETSGE